MLCGHIIAVLSRRHYVAQGAAEEPARKKQQQLPSCVFPEPNTGFAAALPCYCFSNLSVQGLSRVRSMTPALENVALSWRVTHSHVNVFGRSILKQNLYASSWRQVLSNHPWFVTAQRIADVRIQ